MLNTIVTHQDEDIEDLFTSGLGDCLLRYLDFKNMNLQINWVKILTKICEKGYAQYLCNSYVKKIIEFLDDKDYRVSTPLCLSTITLFAQVSYFIL